MGEKRIDELNDALYPSYYHYLPIDRDIAAETEKLKADYFGKANDSSDIRCLGNTNNTGAIIPSGKYFYKYDTYHSNRALAKAISNIAVNATLTENTNFKYVTIGEELDSLNAALSKKIRYDQTTSESYSNVSITSGNSKSITASSDGLLVIRISGELSSDALNVTTRINDNVVLANAPYGFGSVGGIFTYTLPIYENDVIKITNNGRTVSVSMTIFKKI